MRVRVRLGVFAKRPEIADADVETAFEAALRSRGRDTNPVQWVGVGVDRQGRLLEFIAVEDEPDGWLVFQAMLATQKALNEVGLGG